MTEENRDMRISGIGAVALALGALNGGIAVALGAWAAHGAPEGPDALIRTAGVYQMWHALAMIGAALVRERTAGTAGHLLLGAIAAFALGIVLFCGGLVTLAQGIVTHTAPWGGYAFLGGWLLFAGGALCAARRPPRGGGR